MRKNTLCLLFIIMIMIMFGATTVEGASSNNPKPQLYLGPDYTVVMGNEILRDGWFNDADDRKWSATVDYGDGLGEITLHLNPDMTFQLKHTYTGNQDKYSVKVKFTSSDGMIIEGRLNVYVVIPEPVIETGPDIIINRGAILERTIRIKNYTNSDWNVTVNRGDGTKPQIYKVNSDGSFKLNLVYTKNGTYQVTVKMSNKEEKIYQSSFEIKVKDYVIQANMGEKVVINQGETLDKYISLYGPIKNIEKIVLDYGDGSETKTYNSNSRLRINKTYNKVGNFNVTLNIKDLDGDIYVSSFPLEVKNLPPVVRLGPDIYTNTGYITKFGTFSDPGNDKCRVDVYYGDDEPTIYGYPNNGNNFVIEHHYKTIGKYYLYVWVSDGNGGMGWNHITVRYNVD